MPSSKKCVNCNQDFVYLDNHEKRCILFESRRIEGSDEYGLICPNCKGSFRSLSNVLGHLRYCLCFWCYAPMCHKARGVTMDCYCIKGLKAGTADKCDSCNGTGKMFNQAPCPNMYHHHIFVRDLPKESSIFMLKSCSVFDLKAVRTLHPPNDG